MNSEPPCKIGSPAKSEFGFWTVLAAAGVIGGAVWAVATWLSLGPNLEDGLYTTAGLFTIVILVLRPAWSSRAFWRDLIIALAAHLFFLAILLQVFAANAIRMGGPWRTLGAMIECLFLLSILWRRNVSGRR